LLYYELHIIDKIDLKNLVWNVHYSQFSHIV
jgi:hypothetical protein